MHFVLHSALLAALDVDVSTFDSHVGGRFHTLVEFYAPWCEACSAFEPALKAAAATLKRERGDVRALLRVDGDAQAALRTRFKVVEAPGLLLFPAEQPASTETAIRYDGALEQPAVLEWARKQLNKLAPAVPPKSKLSQPQSSGSFAGARTLPPAARVPTRTTPGEGNGTVGDDEDVQRHARALLVALRAARGTRWTTAPSTELATVDAELLELLERRAALGQHTQTLADGGTQAVALDAMGHGEPVARPMKPPMKPQSSSSQTDALKQQKPPLSRKQSAATDSAPSPTSSASSSRSDAPKPLDKSLEEELDALLSEEDFNLDELDALFAEPPEEGSTGSEAARTPKAAAGTSSRAAADSPAAKPKAKARGKATDATSSRREAAGKASLAKPSPAGSGGGLHQARERQTLEAELDELLGPAPPGEEATDLLDEVSANMEELFPEASRTPTKLPPSPPPAGPSTPTSRPAAGASSSPAGAPSKRAGKSNMKQNPKRRAKGARDGAPARGNAMHDTSITSADAGTGQRAASRGAADDDDDDDEWYVD